MTYDEMLDYYYANGGGATGAAEGDVGQGAMRPVIMPDGRRLIMNEGGQLMMLPYEQGWGGGMQSLRNAIMVLGGTAALGNLAMPALGSGSSAAAAGGGGITGGAELAAAYGAGPSTAALPAAASTAALPAAAAPAAASTAAAAAAPSTASSFLPYLPVASGVVNAAAARSAGRSQADAAADAARVRSDAADRAAEATLTATRESNQLLRDMFDQNRRDAQPYMDAGGRALTQIETGMADTGPRGLDRDLALDPNIAALSRSAADIAGERYTFSEDPGYHFRLREGERALDRAASAGGRFDSGRAMKDLLRYGQDYASNEYGTGFDRFQRDRGDRFDMTSGERTSQFNMAASDRDSRFNRLSSLAGTGQSVTSQIGDQGIRVAGSTGDNTVRGATTANTFRTSGADARAGGLTDSANARTSGYVGGINAINTGIGQGIQAYQDNRLMDLLRPRR
jgi:hypothetical protein